MTETLHASCVVIDGRAVLIEGPSGSGKSDLALRLIDRGAILVSDDYTVISARPHGAFAGPPARLAGQIEVRGIGIVEKPHVEDARVALLVTLAGSVQRMPEAQSRAIGGHETQVVSLDAREHSAPIKVELALAATRARV